MINILLKSFFWLALSFFCFLVSVVCADYFDWTVWQQLILFIGFIAFALFIQWMWRKWKVSKHFKALSISHTLNFNAKKALALGLEQLCREQQLPKEALRSKPWYIGIAFGEASQLQQNSGQTLDNHHANLTVRLLVLEHMFILQFEFTSRLLLDWEVELYQQYLLALENRFSQQIAGQLYFIHAPEFDQITPMQLAEFSDNIQKIAAKTLSVTKKHYPMQMVLHGINAFAEYPVFTVRLPRKVKAGLLGWQANRFEFFNADAWLDTQKTIIETFLLRSEYCFAHNIRVSSVDGYQMLNRLNQHLASLQQVFNGLSKNLNFVLTGIYWVESLDYLHSAKFKTFTSKLFNSTLATPVFKPKWTAGAAAFRTARNQTLLAAYLLLAAGALTHLAYAYHMVTKATLAEIQILPKRVTFYNEMTLNLRTLGEYQEIIQQLRATIDSNLFNYMPLHAGLDRLHQVFVHAYLLYFQKYALNQVYQQVGAALESPQLKTDSVFRAQVIYHMMNSINLLNAKLHRQSLNALPGPPLWGEQLSVFDNPNNTYAALYKTYVELNDNLPELQKEYDDLLAKASKLQLSQDNFQWLLLYLNEKSGIAEINLKGIWGGSNEVAIDNDTISPAFTYAGSQAIEDFWNGFNLAFDSLGNFSVNQSNFERWYQNLRYRQWTAFFSSFPSGYLTLNDKGEWDNAYINMASQTGVCQKLFQLIGQQFSDDITLNTQSVLTPPAWLLLSQKVNTVLAYAIDNGKISEVKRRFVTLDDIIKYAKQKTSSLTPKQEAKEVYYNNLDEQAIAANEFYKYSKALLALFQPVTLPEQAYLNSSGIYGGNNAPFNTALNNEQMMMYRFNSLGLQDNVFWKIYQVPLEFYVRYMNFISGTYLNQAWQEDVLGKLQNSPSMFMTELLFSESGIFWQFFNKYLKNYFTVDNSYVVPKFYFDIPYPFTKPFYDLIVDAASRYSVTKQQALFKKYFSSEAPTAANSLPPLTAPDATPPIVPTVTITALPPTLNAEALTQPQQITVVSECAKGNFELTNYNFPIEKALPMPLSACAKTYLRIYFSDFYLEKAYSQSTGLLDFLNEVNTATLKFTAKDFPDSNYYLQQYHINTIQVNYQLGGLTTELQQYNEFLKMQTSLFKQERIYNTVTDLPTFITYESTHQNESLRTSLGANNTLIWKRMSASIKPAKP